MGTMRLIADFLTRARFLSLELAPLPVLLRLVLVLILSVLLLPMCPSRITRGIIVDVVSMITKAFLGAIDNIELVTI